MRTWSSMPGGGTRCLLAMLAVASSSPPDRRTADRDRQPPRIVGGSRRGRRPRLAARPAAAEAYSEPIRHAKDADGRVSVRGHRAADRRPCGAASGRTLLGLALVRRRRRDAARPSATSARGRSRSQDRAGNQAAVQAFTQGDRRTSGPRPAASATPAATACRADRDGDGVPDAQDCGPADPGDQAGRGGRCPTSGFVDSNCDGIDGTETNAVFVSTAGQATRTPARRRRRCGTIQAAIVAARRSEARTCTSRPATTTASSGRRRRRLRRLPARQLVAEPHARDVGRRGAPEGILAARTTGVVLQHLTVRGRPTTARSGERATGIRLIGGSKVALQRVLVGAGDAAPAARRAAFAGTTGATAGRRARAVSASATGEDPAAAAAGGRARAGRIGGRGGDGGKGDHLGAAGSTARSARRAASEERAGRR